MQVGKKNGNNSPKKNDPANPVTLSVVYFRVGGPHIGKAGIALEVNRDNVLIDHTWVWRADHGVENLTDTGYFPNAHTDNNISVGEPLNAKVTLRIKF